VEIMSHSPAGVVLQHLRQLAGTQRVGQPPDAQLVADFALRRDEDAFAALVRRHGPMVWGVCRSILRHEQDAEDAFQATFLVLARKAPSIRRREAVAGWLYEVAHHTALQVQTRAARRRVEERKVSPSSAPTDPSLDMTLRDLGRVLHEELRRLPDRYRLPLVLCYLEGRSQKEAAELLGWSPGTFRGRLDRGRERLRRRLAARGVALSALLGAAVVTPRAPAEAMVRSVVRAAVLSAPDTFRALFLSKLKVVSALLLTAGLLVATAARMHRGTAREEQPAQLVKGDAPMARRPAMEQTITGKVLDAAGQPIAAELFLLGREGAPEPLGKTAADGTFQVTVPLRAPGAYLAARAEGHAIDFLTLGRTTPADVTLRLDKDSPIQGQVLDTQGRPAVGVEVSVRSFGVFSPVQLDRFLAYMKKREPHEPILPGQRQLALGGEAAHLLPSGERLLAARTDTRGRFAIRNVPASCTVWLDLQGRGIAQQRILVVNRPRFDPAPINEAVLAKRPRDGRGISPTLMGPQPTVVVEAEKVLRGVVRETDTSKPLSGLRVRLDQQAFGQLQRLSAVTDARGRYEMRGARPAARYRISVLRDTATAMLGRTVEVADNHNGLEPQNVDITP
jgi:RNA polymerase sigma factor (sigma-70 family)